MTSNELTAQPSDAWGPPTRPTALAAFRALLGRDLRVLRRDWIAFLVGSLMQPLLLVFVFTTVLPKIGLAVGGTAHAGDYSTLLVAGVVGLSMFMQGLQAVTIRLAIEFGYTKEIEDRVLAPLPVWALAVEKVIAAAPPSTRRRRPRLPDRSPAAGDTRPPQAAHPHPHPRRPPGRTAQRRRRPRRRNARRPLPDPARLRRTRPARHLPRRRLLPLGDPHPHPLAESDRARKPARLHQRRNPRQPHHRRATHEPRLHRHCNVRIHARPGRARNPRLPQTRHLLNAKLRS
jgi:hypothetical protein